MQQREGGEKREAIGGRVVNVTHFLVVNVTHLGLQFASVDAEQYIVMRHIFLQQLGLDASFDFLDFVKESMETEFASLVGVGDSLPPLHAQAVSSRGAWLRPGSSLTHRPFR